MHRPDLPAPRRAAAITPLAAALALGLATLGLAVLASPASAQLTSGQPIRIIVPFAPAGSSDVIARVLQVPLQQALNHTVIVENRAGAGSNLGTTEVARAKPDGYTLLVSSSAFVANPALYKTAPFDPAKDFVPIATLPVAPNIVVVQAASPMQKLADLIARAKANPGKLNYATPGNGTTPQLMMELFKLKAGVDLTNIAYGGGGPATMALLSGTVDVLSTALPGAQEQVKTGSMRGLAITTAQRWPDLLNVPTFADGGLPEVALDTEHFFMAPAGTPRDVVELLTKAALTALAGEDVKKRVRELGYVWVAGGPDAVKERIAKQVPLFKELVANAKIPPID
jgi:tripartite-type tricarboxylate transporter receptor subunit TctC